MFNAAAVILQTGWRETLPESFAWKLRRRPGQSQTPNLKTQTHEMIKHDLTFLNTTQIAQCGATMTDACKMLT